MSMSTSTQCSVPGCGRPTANDVPRQTGDGLCPDHFSLASVRSRGLWQSAAKRLARLQRSWEDDRIFDEITARGRYLAFCALLEAAHDHVDRAWARVRAQVLAAAGDIHPGSPGTAPGADVPNDRLGAGSSPLDGRRRLSPAPQE
jgi:hypothetical protein